MELGRRGFQSFLVRQFRISPIIFNVSHALEDTLVADDCDFGKILCYNCFKIAVSLVYEQRKEIQSKYGLQRDTLM